MTTEFYALQLTRAEMLEVQASLMQRAMVEDDLRHEKGLESLGGRPLLERVNHALHLAEPKVNLLEEAIDSDLWEHAWYTFTDEWAWFRAAQEVKEELEVQRKTVDATVLQRMVEHRYSREFERYVKEIDMREPRESQGSARNEQPSKTA